MNNEHSLLAPSSAARRMACPGSRYLESLYPQTETSDAAREGEQAHRIAASMLKDPTGIPIFGSVFVPDDMMHGARLYIDDITKTATISEIHIEDRVDISCIHPEMWGTPDAWCYDLSNMIIYIWDYKYGFGQVEVYENWQLIAYSAGILDLLQINPAYNSIIKIIFTIVQPRGYHRDGPVRKWEISYYKLQDYFDLLRINSILSLLPAAPVQPSPQCTYCRARHACPALQQAALTAVDMAGENVPFDLNPTQTGSELRILHHSAELLDARITGVEQQAISMIKRGDSVTGYMLESSPGREVWGTNTGVISQIAEVMGIDIKKPAELITPKQAIKAGIPKDLVNKFSEYKPSALKLTEVRAERIFGGEKCT